MSIVIILGTRPEIIKLSPIIRKCERRHLDYFITHTGQHYAYQMDKIFFEQLELPQPRYNLDAGSGSHAEQTGKIMVGIEKILAQENPKVVLVQGDTNSVLAGAIAASKVHIRIGHVEAGLRSFDRNMPEEINRIVADHLSDYLYAPTDAAKANLINEGISDEKIYLTGNTIVDSVYQNSQIARRKSRVLKELGLSPRKYFLVTAHRAENVDARSRLKEILRGIELIGNEFSLPVIFPVHPRTRKAVKEFGFSFENIHSIDPVGFLEFLQIEANARLVLTDSGGVQEESCILGIPCVTLRENTERPETIDVGSNILVGTKAEKILEGTRLMLGRRNKWKSPFGNGHASEIIMNSLR
jgi:UDP-N-acetylglucosamine 2-epimerase (non-hydrolysing)